MEYMVVRNKWGDQVARINLTIVKIVWTVAFLALAVSRMI